MRQAKQAHASRQKRRANTFDFLGFTHYCGKSRAKDNLQYDVIERLKTTDNPRILRDEIIELTVFKSRQAYHGRLRRIVAIVEIDGKDEEVVFLSNHFEWSAWTVAELYRSRWDIEAFFKEIKQTLQLADFLGHNSSAVRWQIWIGLLVHLILRYLAHLSSWAHSFTRLFTVLRAVLWYYLYLDDLLNSYGTATCCHARGSLPELGQGSASGGKGGAWHIY